MAEATVEQRLTALERHLAEIRTRLDASASHPASPSADWLSAISGSMRDEPDFDEVVRLGRAIRKADQTLPQDES